MTLPVLISVPHGGIQIPDEVKPMVQLTTNEIFDDVDPFAREIFNLHDAVSHYIDTPIARTFVDVNRAPNELADINPDGAIKMYTRNGLPIYHKNPTPGLSTQLIVRYHQPYHTQLKSLLEDTDIHIAFDCHTMNPIGSIYSPDPGLRRPLICLSNMDGATCYYDDLLYLADCLAKTFKISRSAIGLNDPFHGGYILQEYGGNDIPWIQVEFNRELYMEDMSIGPEGPIVNEGKIKELNWQWLRAVTQFIRGSMKGTRIPA